MSGFVLVPARCDRNSGTSKVMGWTTYRSDGNGIFQTPRCRGAPGFRNLSDCPLYHNCLNSVRLGNMVDAKYTLGVSGLKSYLG